MNEPTFQTHHITWRGIALEITYQSNWFSSARLKVAHITVKSGAPLPFTETGYKSHFTAPDEVEEAGGPVAFVIAALDEVTTAKWIQQEEDSRQLALF